MPGATHGRNCGTAVRAIQHRRIAAVSFAPFSKSAWLAYSQTTSSEITTSLPSDRSFSTSQIPPPEFQVRPLRASATAFACCSFIFVAPFQCARFYPLCCFQVSAFRPAVVRSNSEPRGLRREEADCLQGDGTASGRVVSLCWIRAGCLARGPGLRFGIVGT